jgi:hypothetical protein
MSKNEKKCFVISQIGEESSDIRTVVGTLVVSCPAGKDIVAGLIYQVP